MSVIGSATLNVVPKIQGGLANAINGELKSANLAGMGKAAGGSLMDGFASGASIGIWSSVASKAIGAVTDSLGSAASRVDTLRNYPKIMESLGVAGDVAQASMDKMSTSLDNVPTRLDDMASTVQGIYAATMKYGTGLDTVTDAGLALNSMLLAGGQSTSVVNSAMEQFRQMVAKGKPDLQDWRALISAAPGQMDQLSKAMLGAEATADDLYAALGGGKEGDYEGPFEWGSISMGEFIERFAGLRDQFEGAATDAQGGIQTSFANMRNAVTKGVANVLDAFGQDRIASAMGDVKSMINDVFGRSDAEGLRAFATEVAPMAAEAWESMVGRIDAFSDAVALSVGAVADALLDVARDAGPAVGDAIGSVLDSVADAAPAVADTVTSIAGVAGDTISGIAGIVSDVAPVVSSIAQTVLPVVADVAEAVGPALPVIITARAALGGFGALAGGLSAAGSGISAVAGALGAIDSVAPMITSFADVGPAINLVAESGKLLGASGAAKAIGGVVTAIGDVAPMVSSISDVPAALGLIAESAGGLGLAISPVALGVGAAAAAIGGIGIAAWKSGERMREAEKSSSALDGVLSGMRGNTEGLGAALRIGSGEVRSFGDASGEAAVGVSELVASLQDHNRRNSETRASAEESVFMLGQYKAVVDECAGAGEVSAEKQAQLEWALEGIKDATGEAFTAEQVLTGEYTNQAGEVMSTKDAIDQLIATKQQEARVNALQEMYTDTLKEQYKAQKELDSVEADYHEHHDAWVADVAEGYRKQGMSAQEAAETAEKAFRSGEYGYLAEDVETARAAVEGLTDEAQTYADMMGNEVAQANAHWGERESIIHTTEAMMNACDAAGMTDDAILDLTNRIAEAGVSSEEFAAISGDSFAMMVDMAEGDVQKLTDLIADYNAEEFEEKYGELHVDGNDNVVDAVGTIYEWNGTDFVPKYVGVEGTGEAVAQVDSVTDSLGRVPQQTVANVVATGAEGAVAAFGSVTGAINAVPKNTSVSMTANVYGKYDVDNLLSTLANANGKTYSTTYTNTTRNVTVNETQTLSNPTRTSRGTMATGGHVEPRHAAGYIAAGPTRTNWGLVGENGVEAVYNNADGSSDVYPLNNPRYLSYADPLADRIADAMAQRGGLGAPVQVVLDYKAGKDPNQMVRDLSRALQRVQRTRR